MAVIPRLTQGAVRPESGNSEYNSGTHGLCGMVMFPLLYDKQIVNKPHLGGSLPHHVRWFGFRLRISPYDCQ